MRTRLTIMAIVLAAAAATIGVVVVLVSMLGWRGLAISVLGAIVVLVAYRLGMVGGRRGSSSAGRCAARRNYSAIITEAPFLVSWILTDQLHIPPPATSQSRPT